MKKRCAALAFEKIKPGMIVGLGGGSTIGFLVDLIQQQKMDIQIVTPSEKTRAHCIASGLTVLSTAQVETIDLAFDGCDEVDQELAVLKSMGGIHTEEKIIAQMAQEYIVLVDESKVSETLTFTVPITLEVVTEALSSVTSILTKKGYHVSVRFSQTSDGYTYTSRSTILLDVIPPKTSSLAMINQELLMTAGIVDSSLFYNLVSGALVVTENGHYELGGN